MEKIKVETIKEDAIVEIQIGTQFLVDLQKVLMLLSFLEPIDRLKPLLEKAEKNPEDLDEWEKAVYTMLVLITTIEEKAKESGFVEEQELEPSEANILPTEEEILEALKLQKSPE